MRQNEEDDQYWSDQQNRQERRRYGRDFDEDRWERNQQPRPAKLDFPKYDGDNPPGGYTRQSNFLTVISL
jgi:hypothetical protein